MARTPTETGNACGECDGGQCVWLVGEATEVEVKKFRCSSPTHCPPTNAIRMVSTTSGVHKVQPQIQDSTGCEFNRYGQLIWESMIRKNSWPGDTEVTISG